MQIAIGLLRMDMDSDVPVAVLVMKRKMRMEWSKMMMRRTNGLLHSLCIRRPSSVVVVRRRPSVVDGIVFVGNFHNGIR